MGRYGRSSDAWAKPHESPADAHAQARMQASTHLDANSFVYNLEAIVQNTTQQWQGAGISASAVPTVEDLYPEFGDILLDWS